MTASSAQIDSRESTIVPKLTALGEAAESWARASRDGVAVWEIAAELLPEMWELWRFCLRSDTWRVDPQLLGTLDGIAQLSDNAGVAAAVRVAKQALEDYRETP